MAPLFSKVDLNKFRHYAQNEVTLICAKFGKDLFGISKVIGRKTKWPRFLPTLQTSQSGNIAIGEIALSAMSPKIRSDGDLITDYSRSLVPCPRLSTVRSHSMLQHCVNRV